MYADNIKYWVPSVLDENQQGNILTWENYWCLYSHVPERYFAFRMPSPLNGVCPSVAVTKNLRCFRYS